MKKSKAQLNFENNPFSYKDYVAEIRYSRLDASLVGQLKGMKTPLIFKGQSLDEMKVKFRETVDNYLLECEQEGKEPEKQFATDTMISIPTELYREYVQTYLCRHIQIIHSGFYSFKGHLHPFVQKGNKYLAVSKNGTLLHCLSNDIEKNLL